MPATKRPHQEQRVSCRQCMREVPKSEAKVREAEDYVMYFCGLDCLDAWEKGQEHREEAGREGGRGS